VLVAAALVGSVVAATAAPAGAAGSASKGAGTRQIAYDPFTAKGTLSPAFHVSSTVNGHCVAAGVAGNSSYRCFSGNGIYDPCFARPKAKTGPLLCTFDPAGPKVVRMEVGQLPAHLAGAPETRPWAMQLADGQICIFVDAAWGGLGPFGCQTITRGPLADCHVPVKATPWWKAACQAKQTDSSPFTGVRVAKVWT
jgi:hypothetical protein